MYGDGVGTEKNHGDGMGMGLISNTVSLFSQRGPSTTFESIGPNEEKQLSAHSVSIEIYSGIARFPCNSSTSRLLFGICMCVFVIQAAILIKLG